jgi:hypothetical protein
LRDALAPFAGEWRILAAFENMPAADIGARVHDGKTWEHHFELTYTRA